ncbi:hypothetical protein RC54_01035 [Herbaspirillum rubrisubalbicans]|uniref:Uncharacterized protein n=1 Tax=Herbaspirillum rubrisubalbicans TaxID=80842 RepID=A0AAD0U4Q6_9BURK|nr:hypothetical protein RC54_01035 [Herbaspirillum rubrisubalbicans]
MQPRQSVEERYDAQFIEELQLCAHRRWRPLEQCAAQKCAILEPYYAFFTVIKIRSQSVFQDVFATGKRAFRNAKNELSYWSRENLPCRTRVQHEEYYFSFFDDRHEIRTRYKI